MTTLGRDPYINVVENGVKADIRALLEKERFRELGHSRTGITLDLYSHMNPANTRRAERLQAHLDANGN